MQTDEMMRLAFDAAPVGLVLTEQRVIRSCNATFGDLIGRPVKSLIGKSFRLLYDSDQAFEAIRDIGLAPLRSGAGYTDERLILRRDGERVWCRFRARTLTPEAPLDRLIMTFAPLPRPTVPAVALTPRERDVVAGLARGETSKEIARGLGLSHRTIEDVRARLLSKFGVRNAAELLGRLTGPPVSG